MNKDIHTRYAILLEKVKAMRKHQINYARLGCSNDRVMASKLAAQVDEIIRKESLLKAEQQKLL